MANPLIRNGRQNRCCDAPTSLERNGIARRTLRVLVVLALQAPLRSIQVRMPHASNQVIWATVGDKYVQFGLPDPQAELLPQVQWGCADEFGTPSFWKLQTALHREQRPAINHQLGQDLLQEVAACILGGYGIPAELGLAAFERLRTRDLLDGYASAELIEVALSEPMLVGGKFRKYRFITRKALHVATTLSTLRCLKAFRSDRDLREILLRLPGIGPKTASWIVRNHMNSSNVAILDVHVIRACCSMGVFPVWANVAKHYYELETRFLEFCDRIEEPAAIVDALMWDYMRRIGTPSRVLVR